MGEKSRFNSLTGLRGLCIFIIVLYHTLNLENINFTVGLTFIKQYGGYLGNYLFFMVSGFLIAYNYQERIRNREIDFKMFFLKRLIKLYPLYLITNLLALLITIQKNGISALNIKQLVLVLLMQTGGGLTDTYPYNFPTWFICTLLVCYVLYFFLAYLSKNKTQYYLFIMAGMVWGCILMKAGWNFPYCYRHDGEGFLNFCIGCALLELYLKMRNKDSAKILIGSLGILIITIILSYSVGMKNILGDVRLVFSIIICPIIIYWTLESNIWKKFLNVKPIAFLGRISVDVFFWHIVLQDIISIIELEQLGIQNYIIQYLIYLVLLVVVGTISYFIDEKKNDIYQNCEKHKLNEQKFNYSK